MLCNLQLGLIMHWHVSLPLIDHPQIRLQEINYLFSPSLIGIASDVVIVFSMCIQS